MVLTDTPPSIHLIDIQNIDCQGFDHIIIRPIADVHCGNPSQDTAFLKRVINEIKTTPNMYWVGVGDYLEANLKRQKHAGVYLDTLTPREQVDEFVELFAPIAEKNLGLIGGNHDHRVKHDTSFDPAEMIAYKLGLSDKYRDDGLVVRIVTGARTSRLGQRTAAGGKPCRYTLYLTHGATGSALVSGKSLSLQRAGDVVLADVVIGGHVHTDIAFRDMIYTPSHFDRVDCTYRERWYINSASFVKYGAYARTARMRPTPVGCPFIHLRTDCEKISVTI